MNSKVYEKAYQFAIRIVTSVTSNQLPVTSKSSVTDNWLLLTVYADAEEISKMLWKIVMNSQKPEVGR